ncbi:2-hydroxyacid dehydrogenase [Acuticoccus sp. MNP-M23]|uniref:2-hydroxyacid dehydrogenase n=1 Tax=Acuticoccus sp. MNP-M23 TaxID=3072793 RepID=UPI002815E90B|nr:2-hydroxyacid dehydrogenase [Acuticoccus sp. MNP-M23]WMS44801.1 2-hydroxyacid dehydrogenase [Acuticoccus sp. MNP-M23]
MSDVLIMRKMLQSVIDALDANFNTHKLYEADDPNALLTRIGSRIKGVATNGHVGCPPEIMNKLPNLSIISSFGVGYDAIDVADCRARGIVVTNTPDVLTDAMAEITLGLMIALCRKIPQADAYTRAGKWETDGPYALTGELTGKTVGIIGLGRIGKEVARRAQAFKMRVVFHGRNDQAHEPFQYYPDLLTMAREVDWLVSIVPGGAATKHLINREVIDALGPDGMLVNVGRGPSVDEPELIKALQEGRLGGAALDVFDEEPKVPEAFYTMDNVVLSPHQGSATTKTRWAMGDLVVRNLKAHLDGLPAITPVT